MLDTTGVPHSVRTYGRDHELRSRTIPWIAVLELAVFLALLALACAVFGTDRVLGFEPSPLWLPVILLSLQHGTPAGLLAAGTASLITVLFDWPQPVEGQDYYAYWLSAWLDPALWIAVAALIGETRQWQIGETAELRETCAVVQGSAEALDRYADELTQRIDDLERHIATQDGPSEPLVKALLGFRAGSRPLAVRLPALFQALFGSGRYELTMPCRMADLEPGRVYSLFDPDNEVAVSAAALFVCAVRGPDASVAGELAVLSIGREDWSRETDGKVMLLVSEIEMALALEAKRHAPVWRKRKPVSAKRGQGRPARRPRGHRVKAKA